jgi:hypothetical protein
MDVKDAFLKGKLTYGEEMYLHILQGFEKYYTLGSASKKHVETSSYALWAKTFCICFLA